MKKALVLLAVLGLSASLAAQSVADLARREKARREAFGGRHAVVIRNQDLLRVQKTPAVEIAASGEAGADEGLDAGSAATPEESVPQGENYVPRVEASGPVIMGEDAPAPVSSSTKALEAQLKAAADLVDLLTTKMNALRQQYEYQDAMVPGFVIQQQLDETSQRLVKAEAQLARIKSDIDKKNSGKKEPGAVER